MKADANVAVFCMLGLIQAGQCFTFHGV